MASLQSDIRELQKELRDAKKEIQAAKPYNPKKQEDITRSKLASIFVYGYFLTLGIGIILVVLNNFFVEYFKLKTEILISIKDFIPVISSAIGTSLGFVVGYYFKSSENSSSDKN